MLAKVKIIMNPTPCTFALLQQLSTYDKSSFVYISTYYLPLRIILKQISDTVKHYKNLQNIFTVDKVLVF